MGKKGLLLIAFALLLLGTCKNVLAQSPAALWLPFPWIAHPRVGPEAAVAIQKHNTFLAEAKTKHPSVLFWGDSITANWMSVGLPEWNKYLKPLDSYNIAVHGDNTQTSLWRLGQGALTSMSPRVVVVMIGTNNILINSPSETSLGIICVVQEIKKRLPKAEILLFGILPRELGPANNPSRQRVRDVNECLARIGLERVHFVDPSFTFLQPNGSIAAELMPDGVHPSEKGYKKFAPVVVAAINTVRNKKIDFSVINKTNGQH